MADEVKQPGAELLDEAKVRTYIKEKYGIEDDPDTYKGKAAKWREMETELPKYQAFVKEVVDLVQEPKEAPANPIPPTPFKSDDAELTEDDLRKLARIDPFEAIKRVNTANEKRLNKILEERDKKMIGYTEGRTRAQQERMAHNKAAVELWPEAADQQSELYRAGQEIFTREMSDFEKRSPNAFRSSIERAAGRLGVPPVNLRKANNSNREDLASQDVGRGSRNEKSNGDADGWKNVRLNAQEKSMAEEMGLNEDEFKKRLYDVRKGAK